MSATRDAHRVAITARAGSAQSIGSYFSSTSPSPYRRYNTMSSHSTYAICDFARCNSVRGWLARSCDRRRPISATGPISPLRSPISDTGSHTYRYGTV